MERLSRVSSTTPTSVAAVLLGAVTVMFGLQLMRNLFVEMAVYLTQVRDVSAMLVGVGGLALFLCAFLEPALRRVLGPRNALVAVIVALGAVRLAEQVVSPLAMELGHTSAGSALAHSSIGLSAAGTVLFLWLLPLMFRSIGPAGGHGSAAHAAIALLMGLAADTAVKGAFGTIEVAWVTGVAAYLFVVVLWIVQKLLLTWFVWGHSAPAKERVTAGPGWPYVALGPALALELLLFQNIAHQTVVIGWPQPAVYAWVLVANLAAVMLAVELIRRERLPPRPVVVLLGALLVAAVAVDQSGLAAAATLLAGQLLLAAVLVSAVGGGTVTDEGGDTWGASSWAGVGMILMLALLFIYYAGYDTEVFVPQETVRPMAALLVGLAAVGVGATMRGGAAPVARAVAVPALLLLVLPLLHAATWRSVEPAAGAGFPIRVMAYNLHQGFDVDGRHSMESLAEVIEAEEPDIVALQEVSRGWVVNGSVDMLSWLSQRLEMEYVWGPASDSVWGNAILSRFPIVEYRNHEMPNNEDIRLDRAFITAKVDIGGGEVLDVVATHFHAGDGDSAFRVPQARAVLAAIDIGRTTVLMGDLNSSPDDPEMVLLTDAGLLDTFVSSGAPGKGYTSRADDPSHRIDYVWSSPDLKARDFSLPDSVASDHLAVAVTLYR